MGAVLYDSTLTVAEMTTDMNVSGTTTTETSAEQNIVNFIKATNFVYDPAERVGLLVELLIFLAVGLFGNLLLIRVFMQRIRSSRSSYVYNYMIFALALGDVVTMAFYIPAYLSAKLYIINDQVACQFVEYVGAFLLWYVHMIICIAIPLERFFAVCRPLSKFGKREVYIIISCIVVFSIGMATPFGFLSTVYTPYGEVVGCHFNYFTYVGQTVVPTLYFVTGVVAVCIAFLLYGIIFLAILRFRKTSLKLTKKSTDNEKSGDVSVASELAAKTRIVVMLFGVTMFYFICWIPYYAIILDWIPLDNRYKALFFLNNAANFILYGLMNKKVRAEMWAAIRCRSYSKDSQSFSNQTRQSQMQNSKSNSRDLSENSV